MLRAVASNVTDESIPVTVCHGDEETTLRASPGVTLRDLLCEHDLSPYTSATERLNCGGRGICATCGVRIRSGDPDAEHWHDRLADRFGYPRLSCQVIVDEELVVELPDKLVWGGREPDE